MMGQSFQKCVPFPKYTRITSNTEQCCFRGIRISEVVVACGNLHFNIHASNGNVWQSLKLTALNCTFHIPYPQLAVSLQYSQ